MKEIRWGQRAQRVEGFAGSHQASDENATAFDDTTSASLGKQPLVHGTSMGSEAGGSQIGGDNREPESIASGISGSGTGVTPDCMNQHEHNAHRGPQKPGREPGTGEGLGRAEPKCTWRR